MDKQLNYEEVREKFGQMRHSFQKGSPPLVFLLDRVENKRNLAAFFRLADAAGVSHIYHYGTAEKTADYKVKRVSRSAVKFVPRSVISLEQIQKELKASYQLVGLEITRQSQAYYSFQATRPVALVIGNEQNGISPELLAECEACIHIPMLGRNSSMNVSVAAGIATYGLLLNMGSLS